MEFIKYMDLFGTSCKFYIENKPSYWTVYGGILSIISILLYIILFLFLNYDDFKREVPQTTTSSIPKASYRKIKFGEEKIWIPWRIIDYNHKFIDISNLLYPVINYRVAKKDKNGNMPFVNQKITFSLCNETSMSKLDKNKFIISIPLNELYCINMDDLYLGGGWNSESLSIVQFDLFLCKNGINYDSNNSDCTSFEKLLNRTGRNNSLIFEFLYPVVRFQPTNIKNPAVVIYEENYFHLNKWTNKKNRISLKEYIIKDDVELLYSKPKNLSYWGVDSIASDNYFNPREINTYEKSNSRIYSVNIYVDTGIIYSTRQYKKLINLFIDTLPILGVLFSLFRKITKIFKHSSTNKKVLELLFQKLQQKANKFNELNIQVQNLCQSISHKNIHRRSVETPKINKNTNNNSNKYNKFRTNIVIGTKSKFIKGQVDNSEELINSNQMYQKNLINNQYKVIANKTEVNSFKGFSRKSYYRDKVLFPFKYYIFSVLLKNIKNKKIFPRGFTEASNFVSHIFDVTTYVSLKKEFDTIVKALKTRKILDNYQSPERIDINRKSFVKNMNNLYKEK